MEAVTAEVNAHAAAAGQAAKSVDEVAVGFVRVANETMCRPIRALTQMKVGVVWWVGGWMGGWARGQELRAWKCFSNWVGSLLAHSVLLSVLPLLRMLQGYDVTQHVLACFGGAGGQHACAIAAALGIPSIFIQRYSGILSALGIGLAEVVEEMQARPWLAGGHVAGLRHDTCCRAVTARAGGVRCMACMRCRGFYWLLHSVGTGCLQEPSAATLGGEVLPELNRRLDALQTQATTRLQEKVRAPSSVCTASRLAFTQRALYHAVNAAACACRASASSRSAASAS